MVIKTTLHQAILADDIKHILRLVHNQADVNVLDSRGESPIFDAIRNGNPLTVQLLVNYGADLTKIGVDGWNVLHYAVHTKQYEILRCIVDNVLYTQQLFDMQSANTLGYTPLHFAQCPFIIPHFALIMTLYGKKAYLKEANCLGACSFDIQQAIERCMLAILIDRYYRMRLLDIILEHRQVKSEPSTVESIIRTIFLGGSSKENHDIDRLIITAQQGDFEKSVDCIDYSAIFRSYPILELYARDKLNAALVFLFTQLRVHIKDDVQQDTLLRQVKRDAQHEVKSIMTYYRNHTVSIQNNRSFGLV